jgi:hypothetical protein
MAVWVGAGALNRAFQSQRWVRKYGNGSRGKVIRVQKPEEIDEHKKLKERVKCLERLLADANIDLSLERAYTLPHTSTG